MNWQKTVQGWTGKRCFRLTLILLSLLNHTLPLDRSPWVVESFSPLFSVIVELIISCDWLHWTWIRPPSALFIRLLIHAVKYQYVHRKLTWNLTNRVGWILIEWDADSCLLCSCANTKSFFFLSRSLSAIIDSIDWYPWGDDVMQHSFLFRNDMFFKCDEEDRSNISFSLSLSRFNN